MPCSTSQARPLHARFTRPRVLATFRHGVVACLIGLAGLVPVATHAQGAAATKAALPGQELPVIELTAGMHLIRAELANRPDQRARGLMFRKELGPNHGMLFIFDDTAIQCMWMRNTLIPLSVAFITDDGTIANIEDMAPQTEDSHCGKGRLRYALEMSQGWFAKHGIKPGMQIRGIPR